MVDLVYICVVRLQLQLPQQLPEICDVLKKGAGLDVGQRLLVLATAASPTRCLWPGASGIAVTWPVRP